MSQIKSLFSWRYLSSKTTSEWENSFVGNLSALKYLEAFSISIHGEPLPTFSLEPLSALRSIRVHWKESSWPGQTMNSQIARLVSRCPELESFSFTSIWPSRPDHRTPGNPITLKDIFGEALKLDAPLKLNELELRAATVTSADFRTYIHHFRHLERLELGWDPNPTAAANFGDICSILQAERIHLKTIYGTAIHPPGVLDYLSSYSGAERITLKPEHFLDDSPQLVDRFFSSVLNHHHYSLKSLELGANKITSWSKPLPKEFLLEVEKCQRLEELSIWLYLPGEAKADLEVLVGP